jgi:dimethylamine/trimethylamine dehydrogenase
VRDWRLLQIGKMTNVSLYLESEMTPEAIAELGADHVLIATGAEWLRDGIGRYHATAIGIAPETDVLTPDDLMAGLRPRTRDVAIYDDDHYYMGGVLAELLRREDYNVTLVTPSALASNFTKASLEQKVIQKHLLKLGIKIEANKAVTAVAADHLMLGCVFTGGASALAATSSVLVTARRPSDALWHQLAENGIAATRAGDCYGPSTIAAAVHAGRRFAEEFGSPARDHLELPFRREVTALA